jgi:hypothetical protein
MFDLEEAITEWRQRMLAGGIKTPVPLEELESHLREEIERRTQSGLSEAEAFQTAVGNIGPAQVLQNEFERAGQNEELLRSKRMQFGTVALLGSLQLILIGAVLFNSEMTSGQRVSGLAAIVTAILLAVIVGWNHRVFPVIRNQWRRLAVCFTVGMIPMGLWLLICARCFLMGHEFPFGQYLASLLWATSPPLGLFLGVIIGFETAATSKMAVMR